MISRRPDWTSSARSGLEPQGMWRMRPFATLVSVCIFGMLFPQAHAVEIVRDLNNYKLSRSADKQCLELQHLRLDSITDSDPTFEQLIDMINLRLAGAKSHSRFAIHVANDRKKFWQIVRKTKMSSLDPARFATKRSRIEFLSTASIWDIVTDVGLRVAYGSPMFFGNTIVLSDSVGGGDY